MNSPSGNIGGQVPGTPEEIERQIDGTREELARTLDALEARLSPRQRLNDAADSMRHTGERLMRTGLNAVTPASPR